MPSESNPACVRLGPQSPAQVCGNETVNEGTNTLLASNPPDPVHRDNGAMGSVRRFYEAGPNAAQSFLDAGIPRRNFFPHRVYVLPKGGPDGLELAKSMAGSADPSRLREFVLYALPPALDEFPPDLFFDDELQWHRQQFGLQGQVACANVIRDKRSLRVCTFVSDLVQRVARTPKYRTRIDARFRGWNRLLRNAVCFYAAENGIDWVYSASAELAMRHTDSRRRAVYPELFQRVYDHALEEIGAVREGDWWLIDTRKIRNRIAPLTRNSTADSWPKTVCVTHDIEAGVGHRDVDPEFARAADRLAPAALEKILDIEAEQGVKATYNVLGILYKELEQKIRRSGHAIAFHSFDHYIPGRVSRFMQRLQIHTPLLLRDMSFLRPKQLWKCREVDYRVKGYRPPQSLVPASLCDANLAHYNFEWLASSPRSINSEVPCMKNGMVKIPIQFDDYPLYRGLRSYREWEAEILEMVESQDFFAFGLHDCYAPYWLDQYRSLLQQLKSRAKLITLDEVAARITLGHARWFEG
jgi:peptidoglycan/xylan/chitin deacetylase (PgdA/CDA1 family)